MKNRLPVLILCFITTAQSQKKPGLLSFEYKKDSILVMNLLLFLNLLLKENKEVLFMEFCVLKAVNKKLIKL